MSESNYRRQRRRVRAAVARLGITKEICADCGFTSRFPIQFDHHHIDGNELNNTSENIKVLCANCYRLYGTGTVRLGS